MDWEKAKKIVIIMLLMLNIFLLGLNRDVLGKYELTSAAERSVLKVLSQNGIALYTDVIKDFSPMRYLTVKAVYIENELLKNLFFEGDDDEPKMTLEFNKTIFKTDSRTLTVSNNEIYFSCSEGLEEVQKPFSKENAKKVADSYLKSLSSIIKGFKTDRVITADDGYTFEYYQQYKKYKIFCSNVSITVKDCGITDVSITMYSPDDNGGEKHNICSPDEALLTLVMEVNKKGEQRPLTINNIELGYDFQSNASIADGSQFRLAPCYYIYVAEREEPFIINAFTNEMK